MALPAYASTPQRLWHYGFRILCGLILFYLIAPILVIIPLSSTPGLLHLHARDAALDPAGYSTKHYEDFFTNIDWQVPLWNSLKIAPMATLIAVGWARWRRWAVADPTCRSSGDHGVPDLAHDRAAHHLGGGMYFFYSRIGLQGTYWGVVLAHAALGIPSSSSRDGHARGLRPLADPRGASLGPGPCGPSSRCRCRSSCRA
jgi:putative spermidine/putrescine transport system permease protein